ncbi:DHA2 family efflux MFS transporter permease subunit [Dyella sp. C11]|uniref:DHA2 family efflux MFS transporter permease subunit n=1 Tax=Dyella sp. C11 TaxID=2126991 RepID=UPI000D655003|nr:DHA2 family efflux MFS transporter permease subunit [Dyella sp. C11]
MTDATHHERATTQDWVAVIGGALGALIASLDISIVNSALPRIQGEIGASGTEGTWIATGYLVSEVVMIPLTAWLSRVFGQRALLLTCTVMFTLFSMLCGMSHSLEAMVLGRVGQGFFGGALIPAGQTIIRTRLPAKQLPVGMSIFGLIVLLGPLVGPVVGGWLTESVGWQWCFFLNLPIAVALVTLLLLGLPKERMDITQLLEADWLGIVGMTAGLGCLTVVLEEGQRERWFESNMIVWLAVFSAIGFVLLAIAQVTSRRPVLKLRLMLNRSYAAVIVIVVAVGMAVYGILYLIPQFLAGISGYDAEQSGRVLFLSGIPAFLLMPFLPRLLRLNLRMMVIIGLLCFAASCFMDVDLTAQSAGEAFVWSQLLRGVGQIFAFMPLNQASVGSVGREDAADAAGLYNMARNLGGSLGLAILGAVIDRQTTQHVQSIGEALTANAPVGQDYLNGLSAVFAQNGGDAAAAHTAAIAQLANVIQQQATVITYTNCFWFLGVAMLAMIPLTFVLRTKPGVAPSQAAH